MAKKKRKGNKRVIRSYDHSGKDRPNNPPVGLVTPDTDPDTGTTTYSYDPHLDPQLIWAGKSEHTTFQIPTVSLHVHERIDTRTVISAVKKYSDTEDQLSLFSTPEENRPIREAIEFYKHRNNWSNRLVAGDSLLVMNSLLNKEGLGGKVQMVFMDPPYGIKYGSNFQPFVNNRSVKDGSDADLTQEPETIRAFRDTWELGIHSYLTYLRDRLLLARELLTESGSVFVQISDENLHHVRELMDEVFGADNFVSLIQFAKTSGLESVSRLSTACDYLVWYARDKDTVKFRQLWLPKDASTTKGYTHVELPDGTRRRMTADESSGRSQLPDGARIFTPGNLTKPGPGSRYEVEFEGKKFTAGNRWWGTTPEGFDRLIAANRVVRIGNSIRYVRYIDDFPFYGLNNLWQDTGLAGFASDKVFVVQTSRKVIQRCMLMTTDPGDLVFDPTCGSGTTAVVAEQWGRRWITCDTSRVSLALTRQRLLTQVFPYYVLAHPEEGVDSGFVHVTAHHITPKSITSNPHIKAGMKSDAIDAAIRNIAPSETIYDRPKRDSDKVRVTGPFTVESVPAPVVRSLEDVCDDSPMVGPADRSISRSGETIRQSDWRAELLQTGIRGKSGQRIRFTRVEPLSGAKWIHADADFQSEIGESKNPDKPADDANSSSARAVVSFGPSHSPLEQRQVALAIEESQSLVPKPKLVVFAAFQFDPEAAKDIDETNWPGVTLVKAQMNGDLLTEDLKKKRASNDSFWLVGQPDVAVHSHNGGADQEAYQIEVRGFDYYNTRSGKIESGSEKKIAMWLLDPDYDGRSLFPRQIFFPMAGAKDGWSTLASNLRAEIDEDLIAAYDGTKSLPFEKGANNRAAVKIIDDRGIESLKVIDLD
ncbi:site-specific DNA-methyltransferase [Lentisalinibacter sediminis]|uniref:site-specific DNA-methyltransferase n=1 Tax=Lentisalinibacter sediminis TaxID=2992237 RepID=UPI003867B6C1